MRLASAVSSRPELAERILAGRACVGEQPIRGLRPLMSERLRALREIGALAGAVIAVEEGAAEHFIAAVLATWMLDAIPLPCKAAVRTPHSANFYAVNSSGRVRPPQESTVLRGLDSTAVLHLTSGSTGVPKLARRGCASVLNEAEGYRLGLPLGPEDRVYVPVPLAHSYGWGVALGALLAGARVDALPLVNARRAAAQLKAATVVAITAPIASLLTSVSDSTGAPEAGPRIVMVGASRVTALIDDAFHARFGVRLSRNYGSSETGAILMGATNLPDGAIGLPMHGNTVLAPEPGGEGELRLALPPVEGHLGSGDQPTVCWSTGDLVRRDADGTVTFVARLRASTRVNDRDVDVHQLEQVLRRSARVEDVFPLVLPRSDGETEDLYAVVAGSGIDPASIEQHRNTFPDGAQAVRLVYCEHLPLTATGKVDRAQVIEFIHEWRRSRR